MPSRRVAVFLLGGAPASLISLVGVALVYASGMDEPRFFFFCLYLLNFRLLFPLQQPDSSAASCFTVNQHEHLLLSESSSMSVSQP